MLRPLALISLLLTATASRAASPLNLTPIGRMAATSGFTDALFVHDNLVFFLDGDAWLHIVDADDPANLVELARVATAGWPADMHGLYYSNSILYAGVQQAGGGVHIFDVSDPANPRAIGTADPAVPAIVLPNGAHNLRLAGHHLYVSSNAGADPDIVVFDVSDPSRPVRVNQFSIDPANPGDSYCHDVGIMDGVAYASMWDAGVWLLDVTDPARSPLPVLASHPAGENTHSAWPTSDLGHIVTCHERENEDLRIWDSSSMPYVQRSAYRSTETRANNTVHDVMVVGDFAYVSHYGEGMRILDISDPAAPVEVASYLTGSGCRTFCDGIAQWVEDGRVYYLDMDNGLWIFSFDLPHDAPLTVYAVKGVGREPFFTWNHNGESQYTLRRRLRKERLLGAVMTDIDAELRYQERPTDPAVPVYFYTLNGPWR